LLGGHPLAADVRLPEASHQILADQLDELPVLVKEIRDGLQERIEAQALGLQFEICEAGLLVQARSHPSPSSENQKPISL
jgi:hypothetical protein